MHKISDSNQKQINLREKRTVLLRVSNYISIILIICLSITFIVTAYFNAKVIRIWELPAKFNQNYKYTDYYNSLPIENMDFKQYSHLFAGSVMQPGYETTFYTEHKITYYKKINGIMKEAYAIPEGTEVEAGCFLSFQRAPTEIGFGFNSFPTYEKGWRWVRPFSLSSESEDKNESWYYCKTNDLLLAAKAALQQNQYFQLKQKSSHLGERLYLYMFIRQTDALFYKNGIYKSPDLYYHNVTVVILILIGVLILLQIVKKFLWS